MIKTEKLYDRDLQIAGFQASVTALENDILILDKTAFFPEAGGQLSDRGALYVPDGKGGELALNVTDVQIEDGVIMHRVAFATESSPEPDAPLQEAESVALPQDVMHLLTPGTPVRGEVDMARRFDFMQQHTAEHIISGIVHAYYGYDNVGFRLSENSCTMDYSGVLAPEQIPEIELSANRAIWDNLPVEVTYPTEEEQKTHVYRSKKEIASDELRIVTIPGIDTCACCAPHVARTGEIGLVKIIRLQNWKGGVRLSIAAGARALTLFTEEHDMITALARSLSTSWENIPDRFTKLREETRGLKREITTLRKSL